MVDGALRDVGQNHLLQVVANLAMEPPISGAGEALSRRPGSGPFASFARDRS